MGKRIPKSRKHKKLKFVDPSYTGSGPLSKKRRLLCNQPPTASSLEQETPRQMTEFMERKSTAKAKRPRRRKKKKVLKDDFIIVKNQIVDNQEAGMTKPMKKLPAMVKQSKLENESQFMRRLQEMADKAIAEAKVEEKYNIELVNVDKQGNAQYKSDIKETSEKKKEKLKKYKEKMMNKKRPKMDDQQFELKREKIQFGDIATAPPVLTSKPRKAPKLEKAGKKQLMLTHLLETKSTANEKQAPSIKWKDIAPHRRKTLEIERMRAVEMYRIMKNKKNPM